MDIITGKIDALIERQEFLNGKKILLDSLIERVSEKMDELSSEKDVFNIYSDVYSFLLDTIDESTGSLIEYYELTANNKKRNLNMDVEVIQVMIDQCKDRLNKANELRASISQQLFDIDQELKSINDDLSN